jgi:hypothetical protein
MRNRAQHGLRGSVKACVEESTHPGAVAADDTEIPVWKSRYTTEYDVEGRISATRSRNSDASEWVTCYTYDASGNLLKVAYGNEGEATTETVYFHDSQGRLLSVVDSRRLDNPITVHYDELGKKTMAQIFRSEDYRPNTAFGGSPFEIAAMGPNLPGGGSATTVYDQHDRPTEIQVRDLQGELVSRAVRIYDAQGNVTEERQILDSPEKIIPAEMRSEILKSMGTSLQDLREQLTKLMSGKAEPYSIAYDYDAQGRVEHTRRRIFNKEDVIENTYNEHGDKASEITRTTRTGSGGGQSASAANVPQYSEVRYSYQYDHHGNWTEELVSYRSSPAGTFESSTRRQRSLTYY